MKKTYTILTALLFTILLSNVYAQTPNCTTNIFPANLATNINPYPYITFKWNPVAGAVSYDIYFSTKIPPRQLAGNVSSDTFNFINASYSTVYYWYVVPKNADGSAMGCVSSATSFITSDPPPAPSNNDCAAATSITTLPVNGTTLGATESQAADACSGYTGTADDDVWYEFTPLTTGTTVVSLNGNVPFDGILETFSGACGSLTSLACSDTSQVGGREQITMNVTAGTTYKIRVYSFDGDLASKGTFSVSAAEQVLPVALINFKGEHRENKNILSWSTATESDNLGFEIQYSSDGNNFEKLSFVNSKAVNGSSSLILSYEFTDASAVSGNAYYRLKQIDKNGQSVFSNIIFLRGEKINAMRFGNVYPNPAKNKLNITIATPSNNKIKLEIRDLAGKTVMQQQETILTGDNKLSVDVSGLPAGSYFIKAISNNAAQAAVSKFVKE